MTKKNAARVGIDIGGTFTDFALEIGAKRFTAKVLTTPRAPEEAVMAGLKLVLGQAKLTPADIDIIIHGTTLATNSLIERKGARTAFITTEGFRDTLEIGIERRYELYDLTIGFPAPLVPRRWRFTVPERIAADGSVIKEIDLGAVAALVPTLRQLEIESVAIGFLHSYVNPQHELAAAELLERELPGVPVSCSAVVSPEMREYERFSTVCANAYVRPLISGYLDALETLLREEGYRCPLLLMLSSGGLTSAETAGRFPVRLVESGPAGGAIFSSHIARQCGYRSVVSFDMGGTTAKICLIDDFEPQNAQSFEVARIYRFKKGSGLPLRIPVVEMVEIGAGGGSVSRVDELGRIAVGPESAGAEPGPVCYARGGTAPTVTDANVVLGKIDPVTFAGGAMPLDADAAREAIETAIGAPLQLSAAHAAYGVSEMVDENMSNAARVHAVESGKEISERTLIAFGGGAPLHISRVAEKLGVKSFVIPIGAAVGSAVGFLRAPVSYEIVRSSYQRLDGFDLDHVNAMLAEMEEQAASVVRPAALDAEIAVQRSCLMRYTGQGHEIAVDVPNGTLTGASLDQLRASFDEGYRRLYSRTVPSSVEVITWIVKVTARSADGALPGTGEPETFAARPDGTRDMFDPSVGAEVEAQVFLRGNLKPGAEFRGPAVIVEPETTTVISSKYKARVNAHHYLECTVQ